jgi:hypothetical protein
MLSLNPKKRRIKKNRERKKKSKGGGSEKGRSDRRQRQPLPPLELNPLIRLICLSFSFFPPFSLSFSLLIGAEDLPWVFHKTATVPHLPGEGENPKGMDGGADL